MTLTRAPREQRHGRTALRESHPIDEGLASSGGRRASSYPSNQDLLASRSNLDGAGVGLTLSPTVRRPYERLFGTDFSGVRVHDDPIAHQAAARYRAHAFTRADRIYFARDRFETASSAGRRLLGHELAHVVDHAGQGDTTSLDGQRADTATRDSAGPDLGPGWTSVEGQSSPSSPEWSFDPYAENLTELTNRALVDAVLGTEDWLRESGIVHLDYDAYVVRHQRLDTERKARIRMGHFWLTTVHERQSRRLYQTVEGANGAFDVVSVENDELVNGPAADISNRPIMTQAQLQVALAAQGVPTVGLAEYQARMAISLPNPLTDQVPSAGAYSFADTGVRQPFGLSGAVSQSNVRGNLLQDAFSLTNPAARQGAIGEVFFGTSAKAGYGFGASDYNAVPWTHPTRGVERGNFPVVDYRTFFGAAREASVKTSAVDSADLFRRYNTYLRGYAEMMNTEPDYRGFDHYMNNAARGRTAAAVRDQLTLIINADDVAGFRQFVSNPFARETTAGGRPARSLNYQRPGLMRIYDGILQDRPFVLPDGTRLDTVAGLDAALRNNTISAAQHRATLMSIAQQAAAKVSPNPELTRATLDTFAGARGAVPRAMSSRDVRAAVTPEYMYSLSRGGGWRGDLHAARGYGGRGALFGAFSGLATEIITGDQAHPDAFERLAWAASREGLRGGASSSLEALAASRGSQYMLQRGLTASSGRAMATRLGTRFVPGGAVDLGFEVGDMWTDDRVNKGDEVGYRLGRAFVIGGTSALAAAATGAWAGAAVGTAILPGVGTVVGFVVGVLVGALVGFVLSSIIPSYEEMVMEQVPLKEFEKNITAQTSASIQNQALADQELALLNQLVHGPTRRGPHNMFEVYQRRNLSTSPGNRMYAEAMIRDEIHGGCQECHTRKASADWDAQFGPESEAWLAPVDRMYLAALEESRDPIARPRFLDWDISGQTVPPWMAAQMADDPTAAVIMDSINAIQPNMAGWRELLGNTGRGVIPPHVMNSPLSERALHETIRGNINDQQALFEFLFGEVGEDEIQLYRENLRKAQEAQSKHPK